MTNHIKLKTRPSLYLIFGAACIVGIVVAWINPGTIPFRGWLAGTLLTIICLLVLRWGWQITHSPTRIAWITMLAFFLRLAIGFTLFITLPLWGYDEEPPNNGYLYLDAYRRDSDAWLLASSKSSLLTAFSQEFATDQYGGLLSLSAGIYRFLSPDFHRPLLILIITSFGTALGVPFLWSAVKKRWDEPLAILTSWLFALYPESVILASSQMREPFLIGFSAVSFWGIVYWQSDLKKAIWAMLASTMILTFFSIRASAALITVVAVWFWLDHLQPKLTIKWQGIGWLAIGILTIAGIALGLNWLINTARWDLYLMETSSGRIQFELDAIGWQWRIPFIVSYGLLQPVLPAAIVYPGVTIMRIIAIFRSIGWYAILPPLAFAFFAVWKQKPLSERRVLAWFAIAVVTWTLISSIRAGGDQWDNVRYRAIFTTWMALMAAWGYLHAKKNHSAWLKRFYWVECIFVLVFLQWYLSRYFRLFGRLRFWHMILLIITLSSITLFIGWWVDARKKNKQASLPRTHKPQ